MGLSYEQWLKMEYWYVKIFPWLIIASLLILFMAFFYTVYSSGEKKTKRAFILWTTLFCLGIYTGIHYKKIQDYIQEESRLTALERTFWPTFFGYSGVSPMIESQYKNLYHREVLEDLSMYAGEDVFEEVDYLGTENNRYYFKKDGNLFYLYGESDIVWKGNEVKLFGRKFHLVDERYKAIGFQEIHSIYFVNIYIPQEDKNRIYQGETKNIMHFQEISRWKMK